MRNPGLWRLAAIAAAGVTMFGAWRAGANHTMMAPVGPPVVALVNLERVMNNLDELATRNAEIQAYFDVQKKKIEEINDRVESGQSKLNILPKGTPQYKQQVEDWLRDKSMFDFQKKLSEQLIDNKKGELSADLFDKIHDAIGILSKKNGYSLVLSNDADVKLEPGDTLQVTRQLAARKILYADSALDISEEVLQFMNNQWKAGGAGAAAPAAPNAAAAPGGAAPSKAATPAPKTAAPPPAPKSPPPAKPNSDAKPGGGF